MADPAAKDPLGLVGLLLDKKYRVDSVVAEGGFGVVYAGRHLGLGRPVAIKVPKCPPDVTVDEWGDIVGRLLEEARLTTKLRHPAVVAVHDAGMTPTAAHPEGLAWIVMEWIDGETLATDLTHRRSGRTRAETIALLRPVIEAIAAAHRAGIVHRDINPNNIMLAADATTRILDFGIAKVMRPTAGAHGALTTTRGEDRAFSRGYAAPEQLSGGRTGPWTDVHALGLVITEVLCGRPALPRDDLDAQYRATFAPLRPTPATLGVDAGEWQAVLERALALDGGDRYPTAAELLAALETPPARRRRWTAAAAVAAVGVVGVGVAGASWIALRGGDDDAVATPDGLPPPCTSNAQCSSPGAPGVCRPGGCVLLRSPDCEVFADERALASDATVWIGAMFPHKRPENGWAVAEVNAVDLARRDFAQVMGNSRSERVRPTGLVVCDDSSDYVRPARHLAELGVPAVIGMGNGVEVIELTSSLFLPRGIVTVASLTTNPLITRIPHPAGVSRLIWRTTYRSDDSAAAIAAWIEHHLEPSLHLGRKLRVALVRPRSAAGDAFAKAVLDVLRFNGATALENRANYRELTTNMERSTSAPGYAKLRDELLEHQPDVIIYAADVAIVEGLFEPLEQHWPAGVARPHYIVTAAPSKEALAHIRKHPDRRRRFFGASSTQAISSAAARFVTHYNETFSKAPVTMAANPCTSYDAFYMLAFAAYTIRDGEPITGERLARGFTRLVPQGRRIEVGIAGIFDAYAELRADRSIDLVGATGELDFDLATGEASLDQAILCVVDNAGEPEAIESGMLYSPKTRRLSGQMRCP